MPVLRMNGYQPTIPDDAEKPETGDVVAGTSLWRDAWRRLLKNRLAVFGLVVVAIITVASLSGPFVIKQLTGINTVIREQGYTHADADVHLLARQGKFIFI